MSQSRLTTALSRGALRLPDGPVVLIRPPAGYDISALPRDRLRIVHGFRPDHDHWAAQGLPTDTDLPGEAGLSILCLPRSKLLARALIAAAPGAMVVVDGQRTDGADSLWREVRDRVGEVDCLTQGHGRLFWFAPQVRFADWASPGPRQAADGSWWQPGVFSEGRGDPGSALLAAALPARLPARMADFGAGTGHLARAVLTREGVQSLDLIEAEALSLDCARAAIDDPRARFHWQDARAPQGGPWDGIVMNPPFHAGREGDPGLGRAFIAAAARALTPAGQLWLVANRHLPYEPALTAAFRTVEDLGGSPAFRLYHAARPRT